MSRRPDRATGREPWPRRVGAGLAAGLVAILFAVADLVRLPTAHGGLLRLLQRIVGSALVVPHGTWIQAAFHVAVGVVMALLHVLVLEPALPGPAWGQGLPYASAVWLANAALVLPLTGEGFAGEARLDAAGMAWFAAAHTLFFLVVAILFPCFLAMASRRTPVDDTGRSGWSRPRPRIGRSSTIDEVRPDEGQSADARKNDES